MGKAWLQLKDTAGNRRTYSVVVPPHFAAAAQALATAHGALTATIRLAGGAQNQATAAGALLGAISLSNVAQGRAWLQLKDGAGNRRTYSAIVNRPLAAANASSSGALSTAAHLSGNGIDVASASAGLINWQTVTLTNPLYTGTGSILDTHFWQGAPPVAGNIVVYDGTHMTILPNGEIEATSNNFTALVQYNNGGGWQLGSVTILPTAMVSFAGAQSSASGALSGGSIGLSAAAVDVSAASAALIAAILFRSNATAQAQALGALTALIKLAGGAAAQSSASGSLGGGAPIALAAAAVDQSTASGAITAHIQMAAAALVVAAATGGLLTGNGFAGNAHDQASATAGLTAMIKMLATASAQAGATGALDTGVLFNGAAIDTANASGMLATLIKLRSDVQSVASASGALDVGAGLWGNAQDAANAYADLMAQINFNADAIVETSSNLSLITLGPVVIAPQGRQDFNRSRRTRVLH